MSLPHPSNIPPSLLHSLYHIPKSCYLSLPLYPIQRSPIPSLPVPTDLKLRTVELSIDVSYLTVYIMAVFEPHLPPIPVFYGR